MLQKNQSFLKISHLIIIYPIIFKCRPPISWCTRTRHFALGGPRPTRLWFYLGGASDLPTLPTRVGLKASETPAFGFHRRCPMITEKYSKLYSYSMIPRGAACLGIACFSESTIISHVFSYQASAFMLSPPTEFEIRLLLTIQ